MIDEKYIKNNIINSNKKRRINEDENTNPNVFILNNYNMSNYYLSNPDILIIVNTSSIFSQEFLLSIINGGKKLNITKIITSDSVITRYISYINNMFKNLFPNCKTIRINSTNNDFSNISYIIDDIEIIQNIEYVLDDYVFFNNSIFKYDTFTKTFFTGNLLNIKNVKIINNISVNSECLITKKIINNIIDFNFIEKSNKKQLDIVHKHNIGKENINNISLEYYDTKENKSLYSVVVNTFDIDFIINNFL
jgi:hypothetical protein